MAIIQVWSAPSCQAGAVCFGALAPWVSAAGSEATGTPASFRVTVTRDVADGASLAEGRCLRVLSQGRGEQWFFVSSVADSDGDGALVQVTAGPLRQLLTVRGLVRSGATFAFTTGKQTVASLLSTYVLTNLSDDGLAWLSLGTVDFTDTLEIGNLERTTRAGVLDAIENATGHVARLRGLYSAGVLTGFALDVIADPAAGLETVTLEGAVGQLQRTRDALRAATVAVPFDASGKPMDRPVWQVTSITGTGPVWVTLRDPASGNPWPIRENGQTVGAYLEQGSGTRTIIADSRASDSAVQLASAGTLAVNDLVTIVRDTAGAAVVEVPSPAGIASSRGRLVATVSTKVSDARRNYVQNGIFSSWTSDTQPTAWTTSGITVARYPRNTVLEETALVADGTLASGASVIAFRGGTPGQRLYRGEYFNLPAAGGLSAYIASNTVLIDGTGRGSFSFMSATGAPLTLVSSVADGSPIGHLRTVGGGPISTQRPASFPDDAKTDLCRFLQQASGYTGYLQSATFGYVYTPQSSAVSLACGVSMRTVGAWTTAAQAVRAVLRNISAGSDLVTASCTLPVPASSTVHETITASVLLSANATLALRVFPGEVYIGDNFTTRGFQALRWASVWVGSGAAMGPQDGSGSNTLWHRAQDVLASSASGTRFVLRGLDLTRLVQENGALALNQLVRVRNSVLGLDVTVRVVKLDYSFEQTETLNLELGAVVPRLSGVTVSL